MACQRSSRRRTSRAAPSAAPALRRSAPPRGAGDLRLLAGSSGRSWAAADIARELGLVVPEAAKALDHLCARNLLDIRIGAELNFRYSPGSEEIRLQAEAFLRVLDTDPVVLAQWMADHQREREQSGALRAFVDALLLRGPGKDD